MALISCPECGQNVSDKAEDCIHCGYPIRGKSSQSVNGSLVIYGYTGWFLVKPIVRIYFDGKLVGDVGYKAKTREFPITKPTNVELKCSIRSTLVRVLPGKKSEMHIEFDRASGSIVATITSH